MRSIRCLVALTLVAAMSWGAVGRDPTPGFTSTDQWLIEEAKSRSEIMTNLTYLSDVIGPRLTGSDNLKRANDWAAAKMKEYGLENVALEPWELPVGWQRGTATARIVEPNTGVSLTVAAMGWTPGTSGKVTGNVIVIDAKDQKELQEKYAGKLKDAIVLRGKPADVAPINDTRDAFFGPQGRMEGKAGAPKSKDKAEPKAEGKAGEKAGPGAGRFNNRDRGESMRNRREMGEYLRKEGVAVLLNDSAKPHGLMNMTGSWGGPDRVSGPQPLPTLFVAHEQYAMLYRLATRPDPAVTKMEVEITNTMIPGPLPVYNNVGEIRGSEKPDEFVIVGAHIDSWDLGQGTTDNGTGTSVVLEAARLLAKSPTKPKRTIRFVLFSGEEQGLHGSKAYVQRHEADLAKTSAAVVHDTGTGRIVGLSLMGRDALVPVMNSELACLKELGVTEINARTMGGSDHQSFEAKGVPGFMFRQDPAEYRLTHHSQSDTLDKAREPDLVQGAQVMSILALRLANREEMLPREKKVDEGEGKDKAAEKKGN
ncbi:MAG: M20/M25/M40 family metallo-hydrolase [Gemmataceae bacterium]|nr:M20/M25/M40 family metallo-hydrolase [Gemmataceae bacterium]